MNPTIIAGDFIFTNKWTYGARVFTNLKFDKSKDPPIFRMPGLGKICRNDIVVFNFPYRNNKDSIQMNLEKIFVKRCVGIAGDILSVVNGYYHIADIVDTIGYIPEQMRFSFYHNDIDSTTLHTFPFDSIFHWNIINFGPLHIPTAGMTIALTPANFKLYHKQITYETRAVVTMKDSSAYINDSLVVAYTFIQNWYFFAGDNVMNSQDSRYFGLVPEAYIIGKSSIILSSKNIYTGKMRWKRLMKSIK